MGMRPTRSQSYVPVDKLAGFRHETYVPVDKTSSYDLIIMPLIYQYIRPICPRAYVLVHKPLGNRLAVAILCTGR